MVIEALKRGAKIRVTLFAGLLVMFLGIVPAKADDEVVAKVNGSELTAFDLEDELNEIVPQGIFHGSMAVAKRAKYRPEALNNLIEDELLYQEAKRMRLKVEKDRINEILEEAIKRSGGKKEFENALDHRNLSERQYKKKVERKLLVEKIIEQEINEKSVVTDEEVARYYDENKSRYVMPESRRIWHIVLRVRPEATDDVKKQAMERAKEIHTMAIEGADLEKLAREYSEGNYRVKGGDLGYVHKGRLEPAIDEVVFKLKKGELSDVVESPFGYHIVKINDIKKKRQLGFDEVSEKIRSELTEQNVKQRREALMSRLRAEAEIEVFQ